MRHTPDRAHAKLKSTAPSFSQESGQTPLRVQRFFAAQEEQQRWNLGRLALAAVISAFAPLSATTAQAAGDEIEVVAPESSRTVMGAGDHQYRWDPAWPDLVDGKDHGNTHGDIVVDSKGHIYFNTDTERAVMVYKEDGTFVRSFGEEWKSGTHGMTLAQENGEEVLWLSHLGRHEIAKLSLDGKVLFRRGYPAEAKVYDNPDHFRPTGIAIGPSGAIFVVDGYGLSYVHKFAADGSWIKTFGGLGKEAGRFRTCHGLTVDYAGDTPTLVIADRENGRLQRFSLDGELIAVLGEGKLRRPCKVVARDGHLLVPDLAGRVTILDGQGELITHLGDQKDPGLRAKNGVPREKWENGSFLSPHSAAWDADGDLYVMDWNFLGRVTRLERVR